MTDARWQVQLRHSNRGWEWHQVGKHENAWWGYYKTEGQAKSAAKRSIPKVVGGKTSPADFKFTMLGPKQIAWVEEKIPASRAGNTPRRGIDR